MEMRSAEVQIVVCASLIKSAEATPSANRKYKIFTQV